MPVDITPLFRPEALRPLVAEFELDEKTAGERERLGRWVSLLGSAIGREKKESELLPDFLTDVFQRALGYRGPADQEEGRFTISREKLVEVDGKFADAVLGEFGLSAERFVIAVEGKGPKDPLDRPFGGRRMSAVDQAYRYAINLPCDWAIVTNLREVRLYHKGSTQRSFERFLLRELAQDQDEFKRFVFVLGAARVTPAGRPSHLPRLLEASRQAGERLTQDFYGAYADTRHELMNALMDSNPNVEPTDVLSGAQRLLDRVLFIAFAEDRSLLPAESLAHAYEHRDPYHPRPVWENFRGLFHAINHGSEALNIPRYNGGLFTDHELLDEQMVVPDDACGLLKRLGDYNFGAPEKAENGESLVDVEILGHIFEQSIEDLEAIRSELEGNGDTSRATSRRKREGAFYTPEYVTRYIVSEALQPVLSERFEALRLRHQEDATGTALRVLGDPRAYDVEELNNPQRKALVEFWEEWIEVLQTLRVVDPACGSGAFLIEAFDQLHVEYEQPVERLAELRPGEFAGTFFDPDRTILQNNLYGVDLNPEAVEIARLSIWIKTAQRGKVLSDLNHNIRVGNSLVADDTIDPKAFDWWEAFPEVQEQGGFDIVVGNPPYVRAESLGTMKEYLEQHYETYHGAADLYVYFYELGVNLLRPGGRMSYVVTNKWLKTQYARPLRRFFTGKTWVEEVVDLGHAREVFPDADVFPSIVRVRKPVTGTVQPPVKACVIPRDDFEAGDLSVQLRARTFEVPASQFDEAPWSLEPPELRRLMEKLRRTGRPLADYLPRDPKYGIKTGYNKAYLLNSSQRAELVDEHPQCAEILHKYLRGRDIKRWNVEWAGLWMIGLKSSTDETWPWSRTETEEEAERIFAATYPSVHRHMQAHEKRLRGRADQGVFWWELRSCDYYDVFDGSNIVHTDIMWRPEFAFAEGSYWLVNTAYAWPTEDPYLLGVVNSPLLWSYMWRHAQHGKDEALRVIRSFVTTIPVPEASPEAREQISRRVEQLMMLYRERTSELSSIHEWLTFEFGIKTLGRRLENPGALAFREFVDEVKKRRSGGRTVTSNELKRLKSEFNKVVSVLGQHDREARSLESEVSTLVNQAFGITAEEEALLWKTAPPRTPRFLQNHAGGRG